MIQELTNKIKKIIPEIEEEMEEQEQTTEQAGDFIRQSQRPSGKTNVYERDITLEDVLRCIGEMEDQNKLGDYIIGGQFFTILNNEADDYEELFSWKLGNPLHEQSEETIKELNKLI